jgi:hypothetical protein
MKADFMSHMARSSRGFKMLLPWRVRKRHRRYKHENEYVKCHSKSLVFVRFLLIFLVYFVCFVDKKY